jgi:hypothetical protein
MKAKLIGLSMDNPRKIKCPLCGSDKIMEHPSEKKIKKSVKKRKKNPREHA